MYVSDSFRLRLYCTVYLEFVHVLKALAISVKNMPIKLTFFNLIELIRIKVIWLIKGNSLINVCRKRSKAVKLTSRYLSGDMLRWLAVAKKFNILGIRINKMTSNVNPMTGDLITADKVWHLYDFLKITFAKISVAWSPRTFNIF